MQCKTNDTSIHHPGALQILWTTAPINTQLGCLDIKFHSVRLTPTQVGKEFQPIKTASLKANTTQAKDKSSHDFFIGTLNSSAVVDMNLPKYGPKAVDLELPWRHKPL